MLIAATVHWCSSTPVDGHELLSTMEATRGGEGRNGGAEMKEMADDENWFDYSFEPRQKNLWAVSGSGSAPRL